MSVCNLRPQSRGSCHIASSDLAVHPEIRPNYLSAERDRLTAVAAIRQVRQIMSARALRPHDPQELLPGTEIDSDADLLQSIGDIATTIFHPVGTCRMGSDAEAVVDPQLRLRGLNGLRVVVASIMPSIVSGNTASPVVMIAEKAATMIAADRSAT